MSEAKRTRNFGNEDFTAGIGGVPGSSAANRMSIPTSGAPEFNASRVVRVSL
jgi:hypothetical protein